MRTAGQALCVRPSLRRGGLLSHGFNGSRGEFSTEDTGNCVWTALMAAHASMDGQFLFKTASTTLPRPNVEM